jgi:hypothetical protein
MKSLTVFFVVVVSMAMIGCEQAEKKSGTTASDQVAQSGPVAPQDAAKIEGSPSALPPVQFSASRGRAVPKMDSISASGGLNMVSLQSASSVQAATEAFNRKIIRNADLTLETESPTDGLRKITAAAESNGGFVVTSEFKQNPVPAGEKPTQTVTVVARVPASNFAATLDAIRKAGDRVIQEKVSGQDVSEEYLDLEARLRTKRALEAQFLEIMKQARKVQDALDVQSELADVRTEIERLEGRRRFLENQAALSTITTTLQMPQPIVAATASGFGTSIKRAFGDSVDTAAAIVLFVIQAVIVLTPIALFFGLPLWLMWRVVRRRLVLQRTEPSPIPHE